MTTAPFPLSFYQRTLSAVPGVPESLPGRCAVVGTPVSSVPLASPLSPSPGSAVFCEFGSCSLEEALASALWGVRVVEKGRVGRGSWSELCTCTECVTRWIWDSAPICRRCTAVRTGRDRSKGTITLPTFLTKKKKIPSKIYAHLQNTLLSSEQMCAVFTLRKPLGHKQPTINTTQILLCFSSFPVYLFWC